MCEMETVRCSWTKTKQVDLEKFSNVKTELSRSRFKRKDGKIIFNLKRKSAVSEPESLMLNHQEATHCANSSVNHPATTPPPPSACF